MRVQSSWGWTARGVGEVRGSLEGCVLDDGRYPGGVPDAVSE